MKNGEKIIYEAAFRHNDIFVKVDILHRRPRSWEIYEVKGGTKLTPVYVNDAALQYHVLTGAGIKVSKVFIAHINNTYVRKGPLNIQELFIREDITCQVKENQDFVIEQIKKQRRMIKSKKPPETDRGVHCSDPYDCDFINHCWQHVPQDSVFDLSGRGVDRFALYNKGIIKQRDIPLDTLNAKQRQQVEATLKKQNTFDGEKKVRAFLKTLSYPLYFLDFETFMSPVPPYDGVKPYQNIPFQYSLHYQKRKNGKLYHTEFIAEPDVDPRKPILEQMLEEIPDDVCILTYNMSFEKGILAGLADQFPQHRKTITQWISNIRDLMVPFRQRYIYHWKLKGSYSIKSVTPVMVPELSYDDLEVCNGTAAMDAYFRMCAMKDDPPSLGKIRTDLLEYCKLDTLAMVRILDTLHERSS